MEPEVMHLGWCKVTIWHDLGKLTIEGWRCTWSGKQSVKNLVWGEKAQAIEVYPPQQEVIDHGEIYHLWLVGPEEFLPDLLGHRDVCKDRMQPGSLEARYAAAWSK